MLGSLLMPAACSPTQNADGPRIRICGEWIGQANMVIGLTWYVDVTTPGEAKRPIKLPRTPQGHPGTWVRLSHDCAHGAEVRSTPSGVLAVSDAIRSSDGRDEAVRVTATRDGTATLTARVPGRPTRRLTFETRPQG
jgi:hypothetical protein